MENAWQNKGKLPMPLPPSSSDNNLEIVDESIASLLAEAERDAWQQLPVVRRFK